jgi:hypothetical protein
MKHFFRVALLFLLPALGLANITSQVDKTGPFLISGLPQTVAVGFPFQQGSDLLVLDTGPTGSPHDPAVVLALGSDYTVTGGGYNTPNQMQTGSIVVVGTGSHSVQVNDYLVIMRNVPINQLTSFSATGPLTIQLVEQALDKMATLSQQVNEIASRSLQFENFETLNPTLSLSARKTMILGFDSNGNVIFVPSPGSLTGYTGATTIVTLGTITTGTWNATPIATGYGGLPTGGTAGQSLLKNSSTNYDTTWATPSGGGNVLAVPTPSAGQVALWATSTSILGQTLTTWTPTFKGLTISRTDGAYGLTIASASHNYGFAVSGSNFFFTDTTTSQNLIESDGGGGLYFPQLNSNGFLRSNSGGGAVTTEVQASLTADVTGILPGANGGTNNGFFAVAGPASTLKTFTFPNLSGTVATLNTAASWTAKQTFGPSGTLAGINVGALAGNPSTPVNGDFWYNSSTNALNAYINGVIVPVGGGAISGATAGHVIVATAATTGTSYSAFTSDSSGNVGVNSLTVAATGITSATGVDLSLGAATSQEIQANANIFYRNGNYAIFGASTSPGSNALYINFSGGIAVIQTFSANNGIEYLAQSHTFEVGGGVQGLLIAQVSGNVEIGNVVDDGTHVLRVGGVIRTDTTLSTSSATTGHIFKMNVNGTDVNVLCQ